MLFMTLYAFLIISVHKTLDFMHFLQKRDRHTDGPTNGRTDGRTGTPSYRDARTHLKIALLAVYIFQIEISDILFLDASLYLYNWVCPSVGPFLGPCLGPSVRRLVGHAFVKKKGNQYF